MALRVFIVFIFLFIVMVVYLVLKEPFVITAQKTDGTLPFLEFLNVKTFHITKNNIDSHIKADKILRYQDHDEIFNIDAFTIKDNIIEKVNAKKAHFKDNILSLQNSVTYENNKSLLLKSDYLEYNIDKKVLSADSPFTIFDKNQSVTGSRFSYNRETGNMKADKVKFIIEYLEK